MILTFDELIKDLPGSIDRLAKYMAVTGMFDPDNEISMSLSVMLAQHTLTQYLAVGIKMDENESQYFERTTGGSMRLEELTKEYGYTAIELSFLSGKVRHKLIKTVTLSFDDIKRAEVNSHDYVSSLDRELSKRMIIQPADDNSPMVKDLVCVVADDKMTIRENYGSIDMDKLMEDAGWTVECTSPLEIRHRDTQSFATGIAAKFVMAAVMAGDEI